MSISPIERVRSWYVVKQTSDITFNTQFEYVIALIQAKYNSHVVSEEIDQLAGLVSDDIEETLYINIKEKHYDFSRYE